MKTSRILNILSNSSDELTSINSLYWKGLKGCVFSWYSEARLEYLTLSSPMQEKYGINLNYIIRQTCYFLKNRQPQLFNCKGNILN